MLLQVETQLQELKGLHLDIFPEVIQEIKQLAAGLVANAIITNFF
jgi:hypothetical protein